MSRSHQSAFSHRDGACRRASATAGHEVLAHHSVATQPDDAHSGRRQVFLFTDVVSSTALWAKDPDWMDIALDQHDELILAIVDRHGGTVFANPGDSFGVAFPTAQGALRAAGDIHHALAAVAAHRLTVRIGVHAGTAVERRSNLFGLDVSIAARLAAAADPDEILVSETTTSLTTGFAWTAPAPRQLRGVPSPIMTRSLIASRQLELVAG